MPNPNYWPTISVIIPVYNGGDSFRRCLAKISQSNMTPHELIVVCDGDTDGSWLVAEQSGAKVIRVTQCQGPAKARNLGAKEATGEIIFFVDADVEIYPDTIEQVAQAFYEDEQLGALIGSYDDTPGASNFLSQYRNLFHHYTHQTSSTVASTFWGACGAVRRNIFLTVGGFNEAYRLPCIEDIELGYRLKNAGHHIGLYKNIQVKHLKHWGVYSMLRADIFYRAIPWTTLLLKQGKLDNDLNLKMSHRLSVVLIYTLLASLGVAVVFPQSALLSLGLATGLFLLNKNVYQFFHEKRGFWFASQTVFWHWLYYFYSGIGFGIGLLRYWSEKYLPGPQPDAQTSAGGFYAQRAMFTSLSHEASATSIIVLLLAFLQLSTQK